MKECAVPQYVKAGPKVDPDADQEAEVDGQKSQGFIDKSFQKGAKGKFRE